METTDEGNTVTGTVPAAGPPVIDQRRLLVIIGALLLGMLLAALDQTIVATALPTIAGDLHGLSDLSWIVTAYILASTASRPGGSARSSRRSPRPDS
jgi:MFS family permease